MAAITPTVTSGDNIRLKGKRHVEAPFTAISTADTYDTGIDRITAVAFEPDSAGDGVAPVIVAGSSIVTFTAESGPAAGVLHVWFTG